MRGPPERAPRARRSPRETGRITMLPSSTSIARPAYAPRRGARAKVRGSMRAGRYSGTLWLKGMVRPSQRSLSRAFGSLPAGKLSRRRIDLCPRPSRSASGCKGAQGLVHCPMLGRDGEWCGRQGRFNGALVSPGPEPVFNETAPAPNLRTDHVALRLEVPAVMCRCGTLDLRSSLRSSGHLPIRAASISSQPLGWIE